MDRGSLSSKATSKLSGYSWTKLPQLSSRSEITLSIITNGNNASEFKEEIEKVGFRFVTSIHNKATVYGNIINLSDLAELNSVSYIEIGGPMNEEDK